MKRTVVFILLLASAAALAQNPAQEDTTSQPAITGAGKPDGIKTEMRIGKDGGSLMSHDGKAELRIPAGAISKKTVFSILPITNMVPNGNGKAYRLEPSGIQFQQPVQLIFHYTPEESADSLQLLMGIAMQDNTGQWYGLKRFSLDTVARTISGNISHFSDWSKFDAIKIVPGKARVKVNKSIVLEICGMEPSPKDTGQDLVPLTKKPKNTLWSVNKVQGGNATEGKLSFGHSWTIGNQYTAPARIPAQNPVAVSVRLEGLTWKYNGIRFNNLTLVSNILVYDNAYEVTMISELNASAGSVLGKATYKDTGSFVVSIETRTTAKIIEKVNNNTTDELDYHGTCSIKQLKPGSGNINITGVRSIRLVSPASATEPPVIDIVFAPSPTILTLLQATCPDRKGGVTITNNAAGNAMLTAFPAFPQHIKFTAKEEEQTIYQIGEEGGEIFLKFTAKQIKDD